MSTDTPRRTDLNDEEADVLLDRLLARADEREDVDLSKLTRSGVTRRTLLGGMAAAAGVGALTGNVSAAPDWSNTSGSVGTEANPFTGGYVQNLTTQTLTTDEVNNIEIVHPGDDWQVAIDSVWNDADMDNSGKVMAVPGRDGDYFSYDLANTALPIVVRPGVTIDIEGVDISPANDATALFDQRGGTTILGNGANIFQGNHTGYCFYFDGDAADGPVSRNPANIEGFPEVRGSGWNAVVALEQTGGNGLSFVKADVGLHNSARPLHINSAGGTGWINNNTIRFQGAAAAAVGANLIDLDAATGDIIGNVVEGLGVQVKSGEKFVNFNSGAKCRGNEIRGIWADPHNLAAANVIDFNTSSSNVVTLNPQYPIYDGEINYNPNGKNVVRVSNGQTVAGAPAAEQGVWQWSQNANGLGLKRAETATTITADNTAQSIADMDVTGMALVVGQDQGDVGDSFVDIVLFAGARSPTAVSSAERTVVTRAYSRNGSLLQIAIDDGGVTYDVAATTISGP